MCQQGNYIEYPISVHVILALYFIVIKMHP